MKNKILMVLLHIFAFSYSLAQDTKVGEKLIVQQFAQTDTNANILYRNPSTGNVTVDRTINIIELGSVLSPGSTINYSFSNTNPLNTNGVEVPYLHGESQPIILGGSTSSLDIKVTVSFSTCSHNNTCPSHNTGYFGQRLTIPVELVNADGVVITTSIGGFDAYNFVGEPNKYPLSAIVIPLKYIGVLPAGTYKIKVYSTKKRFIEGGNIEIAPSSQLPFVPSEHTIKLEECKIENLSFSEFYR